MIEVENIPPDPNERTPADGSSLYAGTDLTAAAPVDTRRPPDPCLICGAPAGSCVHHEDPAPAQVGPPEGDAAATPRKPAPATTRERDPRRVRVQGTEDANADPGSKVYVCPEDVVEVFESGIPGRTTRKSRRLVHRKGEVITRDRAIQLGLVEGVVSTPPVPPPPHRTVAGEPVTIPQL